jgi:hypothetical protein
MKSSSFAPSARLRSRPLSGNFRDGLMRQGIDGDVERKLAGFVGVDAVTLVAFVAHGEGADQAILANEATNAGEMPT